MPEYTRASMISSTACEKRVNSRVVPETVRILVGRHPRVVSVGELIPAPSLGVDRGAKVIPIPPLVKAVPGALALDA